jgi:hypothetical protein
VYLSPKHPASPLDVLGWSHLGCEFTADGLPLPTRRNRKFEFSTQGIADELIQIHAEEAFENHSHEHIAEIAIEGPWVPSAWLLEKASACDLMQGCLPIDGLSTLAARE